MNPTDVAAAARRAFADVADLACPSSCVGCGAWGPVWCDRCESTLTGTPRVVVPRLAPHVVVHAAESFEGPLRHAVSAFKDDGRRDARHLFATVARRAVATALTDGALPDEAPDSVVGTSARGAPQGMTTHITLVTVPSSVAAFRVRGRYPLGEVADGVRRNTPIRDGSGLLRHRRRVRDQSGLDLDARRRNVDGAFFVREGTSTRRGFTTRRRLEQGYGTEAPDGRWQDGIVVLLDDVVTSGATFAAAHDALVRAGARRIVCAAIAATPAS